MWNTTRCDFAKMGNGEHKCILLDGTLGPIFVPLGSMGVSTTGSAWGQHFHYLGYATFLLQPVNHYLGYATFLLQPVNHYWRVAKHWIQPS